MNLSQNHFKSALIAVLLFSLFVPASLCANNKYQYPSQEKIDKQVDSVFRKLSTREKIAQIMVINFTSADSRKSKQYKTVLLRKRKLVVSFLLAKNRLFQQ